MDGQILASTLPREAQRRSALRLRTSATSSVTLGEEEFVVLPRRLPPRRQRRRTRRRPRRLDPRSRPSTSGSFVRFTLASP